MRVLVLGGTGFISEAIVRALLRDGHAVACVTRDRAARSPLPGVVHIVGDRMTLESRREEIERFGPDVAIDAIAKTRAEAEAAVAALRSRVERVVVVSSCDVYRAYGVMIGSESSIARAPLPLIETSPLRESLFPYRRPRDESAGESASESGDESDGGLHEYEKILVERAYEQAEELDVSIVRLPMVYGPHDPQHRWWTYVARMQARRDAIVLPDGLAGWRASRGFVDDVGRAVALVATAPASAGRVYSGRVYNVAEPHASTATEVNWVERIGRILDWHGTIVRVADDDLPDLLKPRFDVRQDLVIASERIRRELGFAEEHTWEESLRETLAWQCENPGRADVMAAIYRAEDGVASTQPLASG